jgi:hypothetical protein
MVWQIGLINNDYKILKTDSIGSYNTATSSNYFTITNDGRIGINNSVPSHKLDIQGDARVNGITYTSNIIGSVNANSNLLRINFEGNAIESGSNLLEVYGRTNIYGNLNVGTSTQVNNLSVSGGIVANNFIGIGSNITNLHTSNIREGVLPVARGGTGINVLVPNNILYTNNNFALDQSSLFTYNASVGELSVQRIRTDGQFINSLNANNITAGVLSVNRGGTGAIRYDVVGGVLIGNITGTQDGFTRIDQTSLLRWDNTDRNLIVGGDIKLPEGSNIYFGSNLLSIESLGDYRSATYDVSGIVKLSSNFRIDEEGKIRIAITGSSKWAENIEKHIHFPFGDDISCNYYVGIGTSPLSVNNYRLDVNGDINTSNGVYKVNGVDIVEATSNVISTRITNFNLDDIALPAPINGLFPSSGAWNNKCFTKRLVTGALNNTFEYFISAAPEAYDFVFDHPVIFKSDIKISGAFILSAENYTEISSIRLERNHNEAILVLNQTGTGNLIDLKKSSASQLIINNVGNMGIGRSLTASFDKSEAIYQEPAQKLHVIGNIISTGTITSSYSDERLKTFTSNISNSLDIINNLSGYHYVPNKLAIDNGFTSEKEIGLNAQEVEKVLPEIVKLAPFDTVRDSEGNIISKSRENYLTICYERMAPVFVEAIKELARENKALREENSTIKEDLRKIKLALGL